MKKNVFLLILFILCLVLSKSFLPPFSNLQEKTSRYCPEAIRWFLSFCYVQWHDVVTFNWLESSPIGCGFPYDLGLENCPYLK